MSYYYKHNFISPESTYATVKEELKSYFDTGAVDDLMFPTYLDKCLRKLGRTSYIITQDLLYVENYEARLPDNFYAPREAWMCTILSASSVQAASSFYSQTACTTIQIAPMEVSGVACDNLCPDETCEDLPNIVQAVYKTNAEIAGTYQRQYLLKPGNITARKSCETEYTELWQAYGGSTMNSSALDSFDIHDNKFVTNFRTGYVNILFYATKYDDLGNQLIPDNYRIREYIEAFLKYKVFETLTNQANDETFNQLQHKMVNYKSLSDEAFIMADVEVRKQTVYEKQRRIRKQLNRHNMYELPNGRSKFSSWRRNGN